MKAFLTGILVGSLAMYIAFQSHIVRYSGGLTLVPKHPGVALTDTFADVRDWSPSDWEKHPRLFTAVKSADRVDLTRSRTADDPPRSTPSPESPSESTGPGERPGNWFFGSPSSSGPTKASPTSQVDLGAADGEIPPPIDVYAEAVDDEELPGGRRSGTEEADASHANGFLDELDRAYWESRENATDLLKSRASSSIEDAVDSMFEAVDSGPPMPEVEPVRASQQPRPAPAPQ